MSSERRTLAMMAQAITSHTPLSTLGLNVARGGVWCALSSILVLIVSGSRAGHEGGGPAPGRAPVCGRNATWRPGVRRGHVDAEVGAITAASKLSPGVKYSVNSSSEMAVG